MDAQELEDVIRGLRIVGTDQQRIEVKSGIGKDVRPTLSAFSNTGGGLLIVGLSEKDGFEPVPRFSAPQTRDSLVSRCGELTPVVRPHIQITSVHGADVLVAEVPEILPRDKPCYVTEQGTYRGSYIRSGDGDRRMESYEIDRLLEMRTQPRWDDEPVGDADLSALDTTLLNGFLDMQRTRRTKTFAQGQETALRRLKVMQGDHPSLAALLAMGEYPQEYFPRLTVTFAMFPGTSKGDVTTGLRLLDSRTFDGPIPDLVESAVDAVRKNMRTGALVGDVYRTEMPDYPLVAVREAIVNALMHRDYSPESRGAQVQVNLFVDRLEITNPGGLFGGVTEENLGHDGVSVSRNQRLSTFLESVRTPDGGLVAENRGSGFAAIQHSLAEALMPAPEIRNTLSSFTIVFRRRSVAPMERHGTAPDKVQAELTTRETASTTELVGLTGLSRSAVQQALNRLIEAGVAEATEPPRSPKQRYRLLR